MKINTMYSFLRQSNILDYPKVGLPDTIWDNDKMVILPSIGIQIKNKILSFFSNQGLSESDALFMIDKIYIVGSITSYQYTLGNKNRDGSDIDVHIYLDEEVLKEFFGNNEEELLELIYHEWRNTLNKEEKEYAEGTYHPLEFYFETFLMPEGKYEDGLYELLSDEWEKPPRDVDPSFDIAEAYPDIIDGVETILNDLDASIGELSRDIEDLDYIKESLNNMPADMKNIFRDKLYQKFDEIEESIETVVTKGRDILDKRKEDYDMFSENNINFKYLQRYGYLWLIKELESIFEDIQDTDEISQKDIEKVDDTLKEFSGSVVSMSEIF